MDDIQKILDASNFMYKSQGYVDISLVSKMSGIPTMVVENVISQNGYKESGIKGQFLKKR